MDSKPQPDPNEDEVRLQMLRMASFVDQVSAKFASGATTQVTQADLFMLVNYAFIGIQSMRLANLQALNGPGVDEAGRDIVFTIARFTRYITGKVGIPAASHGLDISSAMLEIMQTRYLHLLVSNDMVDKRWPDSAGGGSGE